MNKITTATILSTNKILTMFVAAVLGLSMVSIMGISFASAEKPTNPNLWGKEASELAGADEGGDNEPGSEMGEHTRESDLNGDDPGRVGVGNIDEELEEIFPDEEVEDHPSGVVDFLCGGANQPNNCPGAVVD